MTRKKKRSPSALGMEISDILSFVYKDDNFEETLQLLDEEESSEEVRKKGQTRP